MSRAWKYLPPPLISPSLQLSEKQAQILSKTVSPDTIPKFICMSVEKLSLHESLVIPIDAGSNGGIPQPLIV